MSFQVCVSKEVYELILFGKLKGEQIHDGQHAWHECVVVESTEELNLVKNFSLGQECKYYGFGAV